MNNPFSLGKTFLLKNDWFFAAPGTYTRYPDNLGLCDGSGTVGIVKDTLRYLIDVYIATMFATLFATDDETDFIISLTLF